MGNVLADITEAGNKQNRIIVPDVGEIQRVLDFELPKRGLWVAPVVSQPPGHVQDTRHCHSDYVPENDTLRNRWCSHLNQMVSDHHGPTNPQHNSAARRKGWIPLQACEAMRNHLLFTEERLLDLALFMPISARFASSWKLIYSPRVHGVSLKTFYRQSRSFAGATLILIEDMNGTVFGGFASHPWQVSHSKLHYGHPSCFVFTDGHPKSESSDSGCSVYMWAGRDQNFLFADAQGFSMGCGSSGFAFWIGEDFLRGTSTACSTFGTPGPLASQEEFVIRQFECWAYEAPEFGMPANWMQRLGESGSDVHDEASDHRDARERLRLQAADALRYEAFT
mmetsp:Transcript_31240/g.72854  ORF Transcript_31240/g.72854 Transcript_31240/m.72854 type:complete len:337 (+) Transcript_31240:61-1071(+)